MSSCPPLIPSQKEIQIVGLTSSEVFSLKLLETTAFIPTNQCYLKKKKRMKEKWKCFICNVTIVDILQHNHMFVKLFVPCKLMNQTILGFQSAFVSENICQHGNLPSKVMCMCVFFKWIFCDLYKISLVRSVYRLSFCVLPA